MQKKYRLAFIATLLISTFLGCGGSAREVLEPGLIRESAVLKSGRVVYEDAKERSGSGFIRYTVIRDSSGHPENERLQRNAATNRAHVKKEDQVSSVSYGEAREDYEKRIWFSVYIIEVAVDPKMGGVLLEEKAIGDLKKRLTDYSTSYPNLNSFLAGPAITDEEKKSLQAAHHDLTSNFSRGLYFQKSYIGQWAWGSSGFLYKQVDAIVRDWQATFGLPYNESSFPVMRVWTWIEYIDEPQVQNYLNQRIQAEGPRSLMINLTNLTPDPAGPIPAAGVNVFLPPVNGR